MQIHGKVNIFSLYITMSITRVVVPHHGVDKRLTIFLLLISRQFQIDSVTQR